MDVVRQIHREHAGVKIVLWSIDPLPTRVREALQSAVSGYLLKSCEPEILLTAIRTVAAGGTYVSPNVSYRPQDARHDP